MRDESLPPNPSEVSVELVDREGGCTLQFAQGGWTEANTEARAEFGDWPVLLERFHALAEGEVGAESRR